uniref:Uncharacterized protein n=1 Tax=Arundo donax TaxID=35708 RepID=A0A0A8YS61_ARUDO
MCNQMIRSPYPAISMSLPSDRQLPVAALHKRGEDGATPGLTHLLFLLVDCHTV